MNLDFKDSRIILKLRQPLVAVFSKYIEGSENDDIFNITKKYIWNNLYNRPRLYFKKKELVS